MKIFIVLLLLISNSHAFIFLLFLGGMGSGKSTTKKTVDRYSLSFDLGNHKDADIKIKNIKVKFTQDMKLKKGSYEIEISKVGYKTKNTTINLNKNSNYIVYFGLDTDYFDNLCKKGDKKSCFNLGFAYNYGYEQVSKDFVQAVNYYDKGCSLNEPNSCLNLGVMYFYGEGVFEDLNKSKELFNKACKLGSSEACKNINKLL